MHTAFTPAPARPGAPRVRGTESAGSQYQQESPQEANPRKQVTDQEQPSDVGAGSLALVPVETGGGGKGRSGAGEGELLKKADETETWVRELTGLAVDGGARAHREQYHAARAAVRLEGEVSGLLRRVAELEGDLQESEGTVAELRAECAVGLVKSTRCAGLAANSL